MNTSINNKVNINTHLSGLMSFAVTVLVVLGFFHIITAIVALMHPELYLVAEDDLFIFNFTFWGWAHLVFGILLVASALGIFTRKRWAMLLAIVLVGLSAVANFGFMSAYPLWSITMLILDVAVIYAVVRSLSAGEYQ